MPEISRHAAIAYGLGLVVVLVVGGHWVASRGGTAEHAAAAPAAVSGPGGPALTRPPERGATVHVAGAVRHPGVYRLRPGARVRDAVQRAGGAARGADTAAVNLAAKLADGQQVLVPSRAPLVGGGPVAAAGPSPGSGPVSLNAATLEQLDALDGVGPVTAQKILDRRREAGGFASVDDLADIPGIGPKTLESLRGQLAP